MNRNFGPLRLRLKRAPDMLVSVTAETFKVVYTSSFPVHIYCLKGDETQISEGLALALEWNLNYDKIVVR